MRRLAILLILVLAVSFLIVGCGGGGSSPPALPPPPITYSISGTVSGAVVSGVTVNLTGTSTATTTSDGSGNYSFAGLVNGSYTVVPSKTGYTFSPTSTAVTVNGASITGENFIASTVAGPTYSISGTVTGPWVEGITMAVGGASSGTASTDAGGNYSFTGLAAGSYTVTPSLTGYMYSPANPTVVITDADQTQNFNATSAITSYSISGTVSYSGSNTGRIYINVLPQTCPDCSASIGTSIASPGAFTIRGLPPGDYQLTAWMDNMGTGARNYSNPSGWFGPVTITSSNVTSVSISLTDSAGGSVATTPTGLTVFPGNGSALIFWDTTTYMNRESATSYKIYWGTDTNATNGGVINVGARDDAHYFQSVANGIYYYKISSLDSAHESAASSVVGPVTIGALTGANTVSGTVTFPGTATGPLYVGVYSNTGGVYFARIASPASPQSYSVAGVPAGIYSAFAIIDMNNNGVIDAGDISNTNGGPTYSVNVSGDRTVNQTLSGINAIAAVMTDHQQVSGASDSYRIEMDVYTATKRPVAVTLVSGPNAAVPADAGKNPWGFNVSNFNTPRPTMGDAYAFKVIYSDATSETLIGTVSGVLDTFAQNLVPVTDGTEGSSPTVPLFTWADPASPPAYFEYQINLNGSDAGWWYPSGDPMPGTQHSVLYNVDGSASKANLTTGVTYNWGVILRDANRNTATQFVTYTP
jgi:hypothetical protein